MKSLLIDNIDIEEFKEILSELVRGELSKLSNNFTPAQSIEYLTRKQVSEMLHINLSTVAEWSKSGKLKPLYLGNRVYFLRSDIDAALKPILH